MSWDFSEALNYYKAQGAPNDQIAIMNLLKEIANESANAIPSFYIKDIAEYYGIKETFILAILKRMPNIRLENNNELILCAGEGCIKNKKFIQFIESLKENENINLIVKYSPCMHMCKDGPNIVFNGKTYNNANKELVKKLLSEIE